MGPGAAPIRSTWLAATPILYAKIFVGDNNLDEGTLWDNWFFGATAVITDIPPTSIVGRFAPPTITILTALRQNVAGDVALVNQPETNVNIPARSLPQSGIKSLQSYRQGPALDVPVLASADDPPGFIGKMSPPPPLRFPLPIRNQANDLGTIGPQPETNQNWIARFVAPVMTVLRPLRENPATDVTPVIALPSNPHFLARMVPGAIKVLSGLRQSPSTDITTVVPDAPPSFVGRTIIGRLMSAASLRQNVSNDVPRADNAPSFIGRTAAGVIRLLAGNRQTIAADSSALPVQPETNPHWIGRLGPGPMKLLALLRQNSAGDIFRLLFLNPNYIAAGAPRDIVALGQPRQIIAAGMPRNRVILGISNNVAQTNDLQPPIDAVVEVETVTFDYGRILVSSAYVTTIVAVSCTVFQSDSDSVVDPTPQNRLISSAVIAPSPNSGLANQAVAQLVGTMIGGITYLLQCVVQTSDGQTLSLWTHITCDIPT